MPNRQEMIEIRMSVRHWLVRCVPIIYLAFGIAAANVILARCFYLRVGGGPWRPVVMRIVRRGDGLELKHA